MCRSFLSPWWNDKGEEVYYSRCNLGVITLNLPYIAAEAKKTKQNFFKLLDKYAEKVFIAHNIRIKRICRTSVDCAPLLWRDGVFARCVEENATIGDIVRSGWCEVNGKRVPGGFASASLGYSGLYECVKILTGLDHWNDGKDFAKEIMQKLNDYCSKWTLETQIKFGVYGSPMESTTEKFAKALKQIMPEYDRWYVTNSYHVPVFQEMDPFTKLEVEGEFQRLSKNGCISYIECADLKNNLEAVYEVQKCIYENCMYAELNIKSCKCYTCGSEEPMQIDENMVWYCPKCGERRSKYLRHLYRVCGYCSTADTNLGRTSDIKDRFIHLDNHNL